MLTGYLRDGEIRCTTGCFDGTADEFESKVREVHGDNEHGRRYMLAMAFVRQALAEPAARQLAEMAAEVTP